MLWGQSLLLAQPHSRDFHAVIQSRTAVWPSGFIVGWISINLKVNQAVQIHRLPFDSTIRQCHSCWGLFCVHFGSSHEYRYLPCSEFAWGKSVSHRASRLFLVQKKINFFHFTQWVKVWGNCNAGSLWKMLFYPTICKDVPSSVCCGFIF